MIVARPVISPTDIRTFQIIYPWLAEDETIDFAQPISIIPPEDDENVPPLFTPSGMIAPDGKSVYIRSGYSEQVGPPLDGTEYRVDINIITSEGHENFDTVIFIIDDRVYSNA